MFLVGEIGFIVSYSIIRYPNQGAPGSVWSQEQVEVVREKVREMVNVNNWWGVDTDTDLDIDMDV